MAYSTIYQARTGIDKAISVPQLLRAATEAGCLSGRTSISIRQDTPENWLYELRAKALNKLDELTIPICEIVEKVMGPETSVLKVLDEETRSARREIRLSLGKLP